MARPIRFALLRDTAALYTAHEGTLYTSQDDWTLAATLSAVRVVPAQQYIIDKTDRQIQLSAMLFFDAVNSRPIGQSFTAGQRIIHDGITYSIASVKTYKARGKLHHYELGLSL